jgi:capsular polysaccharide biosynthesis protein
MNADKVFLRDLFKTINTYRNRIVLICILSVAFCFQLTFWIEKQFTSTFELNVYSKYFQNPLISGVIPDVYNIPEMRFAIDSMVKEAISDEFVDELGTDYKIYSGTKDPRELARERQMLRDRFSYFSTGGQSYQVSFSHSDPYVAKEIADIVMDRVRRHIVDKRIKTIELVKEVMIRKLNSFNASQKLTQKGSEKVLASKSPDVLKEELVKVNTSIEALSKQYSANHPIMLNLKQRQKTISGWLQEFDVSKVESTVDLPISMNHDKMISEQLSSKFYAKYHDFNIALEIEKKSLQNYIGIIKNPQLPTAPIWPKKRLFASLGFILGLMISFIYVFISEIIVPSRDEKLASEAELLNTMVLGVLPRLAIAKPEAEPKSVSLKIQDIIRS